jgi:hypothetical protein
MFCPEPWIWRFPRRVFRMMFWIYFFEGFGKETGLTLVFPHYYLGIGI